MRRSILSTFKGGCRVIVNKVDGKGLKTAVKEAKDKS